ncbi:aminodeoxychorismate synthase component I [Shewanella ulleungensis]|uniref:aminodeoxychorismate synthase n=1 Tax=Shewanella ulleungensis TaxID=2282699 RepID=A0ABQ2QC79_9GAMM|nr:aminodeoxychorismate synthase component I [Shewanella ulleungensis]MCL1148965.1 aminodeoxychorismate synthase component I [Shewanella ulleungensis]GGP74503.1 aminodeoxychorismate synthase, component I [Shewanella ulleungensis]
MFARAKNALYGQKLDWKIDTKQLFALFCYQPWAMLLDSANADHPDAKLDIIAINPIATLTSDEGRCQFTAIDSNIKQLDITYPDALTPIETLAHIHNLLYPYQQACEHPFSVGAVGAWGYDLGRSIEKLPQKANKDIHLKEMNIGFYDFCLLYSYAKSSWFAYHFNGKTALEVELNLIQSKIKSSLENTHKPKKAPHDFILTSTWQNQITEHQYQQKFDQVQQYLLSGDCYQINLTQRFEAQYQGDEWQAYCALSRANQAPFSAFMRFPEHCVLSISPERFIQLQHNHIETKPIKGTLPRSADPVLDQLAANKLSTSEKDRAENVMIVDLLRNDIGRVAAPGSVKVPTLFAIESFPAVHHLVSTVTATLAADHNAFDLLQAAFPGGSITGAPKIRAMQIIEELEPSRRNQYCGSIGYISQDGNMDTSITIRTLVTEQNNIYCWAGGGIVADSNVKAEYQESFDKVSKILPLLASLNAK